MKNLLGAQIAFDVRHPIIKSTWDIACHDKDGNEKWKERLENLVTTEGLEALLDVMFLGGTQIAAAHWYVVLTESGSSATSESTYAVPIYTECTTYTQSNRPTYVGSRTNLQIDNIASKVVFTMSSPKNLLGGALIGGGSSGANTKGDTASSGAKLYCSVDFDELKPVVAMDIVSIAITLTAASA